jgi:hypothetical protein
LELVAAQAESASPDRARALEDLAASIEQRPPFIVDVMRPDPLDSPEVTTCLTPMARTLLIRSGFFRR